MGSGRRERELAFDAAAGRLELGETWIEEGGLWWLRCKRVMSFRGGKVHITEGGVLPNRFDPILSKGLRRAHELLERYTDAYGYVSSAPDNAYERMLIRMAFLAPDLQSAILDGSQPGTLNLETLRRQPVPLCWDDQREALTR